jgi:sulfur carrier protein
MPSKQLEISTMQIYLNGELQHTECKNLLELVQTFALEGKRFAVEQNENIISKSKLEYTPICAMDRIEIIHAVGGG